MQPLSTSLAIEKELEGILSDHKTAPSIPRKDGLPLTAKRDIYKALGTLREVARGTSYQRLEGIAEGGLI